MGTPIQSIYDTFIQKVDEDLTGKESLIFGYLNTAISKCYKICIHSLVYVLDTPIVPATVSYDGVFNDILDIDEIELISMWMLYEHRGKKESYLLSLKREISTKDFNSLPNKKQELDGIQNSMRLLKEDIKELSQQFNTYKYN